MYVKFYFYICVTSNLKDMKNLITILFLFIGFVSFSQDSLTPREIQMVNEINAMRVNPKSYIPKIENYINMCNKKLKMITDCKLTTTGDIEGQIKAANELIEVLSTISPLSELTVSNEMYVLTKAHGEYIKVTGNTEHSDISRMNSIGVNNVTENIANDNGMISPTIIMLLVDAEIEGRGHRMNLLDSNVTCISVNTNGNTWVMNFAN